MIIIKKGLKNCCHKQEGYKFVEDPTKSSYPISLVLIIRKDELTCPGLKSLEVQLVYPTNKFEMSPKLS